MLSDIEIAQQVKMQPVTEIAEKLGVDQDDLDDELIISYCRFLYRLVSFY